MRDRLLLLALLAVVCVGLVDGSKEGRRFIDSTFSRIKDALSAIGGPHANISGFETAIGNSHPAGGYSASDDPLAAGDDARALSAELHGLPSIDQLPPIVPGTTGRVSDTYVIGPHKPHVAWNLALPLLDLKIGAIGVDDTVYISGREFLGAVRDGNILWRYKISEASDRPTLDDDGRVWFMGYEDAGMYYLNSKGEGGFLNGRHADQPSSAQCIQTHRIGPSGMESHRALQAFGHEVPLDYTCAQIAVRPDDMAYVATDAPDIRAVTRAGSVAWILQTPCAPQRLLAGPSERVLFFCQDNSIHYIENGTMRWVYPGDGEIQLVGIMDREGTTYFADRASVDPLTQRSRGHPATHIHALSSTGQMLWTIETRDFFASSIEFDAKGRLYLTGRRRMGERLVCISD